MHDEHRRLTHEEVQRRIREGVKAVIEEVLEEEMAGQLQTRRRERVASGRGEPWWRLQPQPRPPSGLIEQLRVPRAREGPFLTEVFERYRRMTGSMEEAVLEMYLQGVSARKVGQITGRLSGIKISKDATSRIAQRLETELREWRELRLEREYPYLYLDATYLKALNSGAVRDMALLVAIGVADDGYREVLAVEAAPGERKEARRELIKSLLDRGLRGVRLVISDDHESIKQAVQVELPSAQWQRRVVHFERNILAHVPQAGSKAVAADLKTVFQAARRETAEQLASSFAARYEKAHPKAVEILSVAWSMRSPIRPSHRATTNTSARRTGWSGSSHPPWWGGEVKRRTRVVGAFPNQQSAANLATVVMLRVSEDWAMRRYLNMEPLEALFR